jgi:hypothetical protein
VIFVLAFGFWLFSSQSAVAQSDHFLKGEVAVMPEKPVKKDTVKKRTTTQTIKTERVIMGKVKCVKPLQKEEEPVKEPVKVKEIKATEPDKVKEEHMVMGMIAYIPPKEDTAGKVKNTVPVVQQPKIEVVDIVKKNPIEKSQPASESKVLVYPNPSNGYFSIESTEKQTLYLTDDNGKLVLIQDVNVGNNTVNASHLHSGTYTLTLTGGTKLVIKKIIIAR